MNILEQAKKIPHGIAVITDWIGDGGEVVHPLEAQRRADICNQCPRNVQGFSVAKPVAAAIKKFLGVKNKLNLTVKGEKTLGHCSVCTCVNKLQIWQPAQQVSDEMTVDEIRLLPVGCWKLKTLTEITP